MTNLITHLPNCLVRLGRWGRKGSTDTCMHTGSAGGYRGRQVRKECELILVKFIELHPGLASSQLTLGHNTGATRSPPRPLHPITRPPPPATYRSPASVSLHNRCSRLGCRPRHARKQTVIVGLPSIISSFFSFFFSTSSLPNSPGEQSRGPT